MVVVKVSTEDDIDIFSIHACLPQVIHECAARVGKYTKIETFTETGINENTLPLRANQKRMDGKQQFAVCINEVGVKPIAVAIQSRLV